MRKSARRVGGNRRQNQLKSTLPEKSQQDWQRVRGMTRGEKGNGSRENFLFYNVMCEIKTVCNIGYAIWPQLYKTNQPKINPCSLCVLLARSYLTLCDPMGCSCQTPLTKGFCRHGYWSGLLFPSPKGISPAQGSNLPLLHWQAGSFSTTWEAQISHLRAIVSGATVENRKEQKFG